MQTDRRLVYAAAGVAAGAAVGAPLGLLAGVSTAVAVFLALSLLIKQRIPTFVDKNTKIDLVLLEKEELTSDVRLFRFALPSDNHWHGLPIGKHVNVVAHIDGQMVIRPYTPVSTPAECGYLDLVLKVYFANVNPKFPNGGKMSQYLESKKPGDKVTFKGPFGHVSYQGNGVLLAEHGKDRKELLKRKQFGLIAGGTGLTPLLAVVRNILSNPRDKTTVSLLFANKTPEDILLKEELDSLAASDSRFKVWYTVDEAPAGWAYSAGFISDTMIREHLPPAGPDTQILICGPPPMVKFACKPNLEKLGFTPEMITEF